VLGIQLVDARPSSAPSRNPGRRAASRHGAATGREQGTTRGAGDAAPATSAFASRYAPANRLRRRIEQPPSERPLPAPRWERAPVPNLTGTEQAYPPPGALQRGGQRAPTTGDYEAWRPE
jgi:NADH:ubiquinone oxidoreductase subunit